MFEMSPLKCNNLYKYTIIFYRKVPVATLNGNVFIEMVL